MNVGEVEKRCGCDNTDLVSARRFGDVPLGARRVWRCHVLFSARHWRVGVLGHPRAPRMSSSDIPIKV